MTKDSKELENVYLWKTATALDEMLLAEGSSHSHPTLLHTHPHQLVWKKPEIYWLEVADLVWEHSIAAENLRGSFWKQESYRRAEVIYSACIRGWLLNNVGLPREHKQNWKPGETYLFAANLNEFFNPYAGWSAERGSFIGLSCHCITSVEITVWSKSCVGTREIPPEIRAKEKIKNWAKISALCRGSRFFILSLGKFIIY